MDNECLFVEAHLRISLGKSLAAGRGGTSVGLADSLSKKICLFQKLTIDQDPGHIVVGRSGQSSLGLHCSLFLGRTISDNGVVQTGVGHSARVATRSLGWITFIELHALNKRPSFNGSVASGDGGQVATELVNCAKFKNVAGALISSVLAGEATISILLCVAVWHHLQVSDCDNISQCQGVCQRSSDELLASYLIGDKSLC